MKKIVSFITVLALLAVACCTLTACADDTPVLRIFNCYDYIDETIFEEFEEEYNCKVKINYYTDNEGMMIALQNGSVKYDVAFPSEYTVQKMIKADMLHELNYDNIPEFKNIDEKYLNMSYDPGNKYSIPYMWGTLGMLYNTTKTEEPTSWSALWDEKYANQIYMISTDRDSFAIALMKNGISINDHSEENIQIAFNDLMAQKPLVKAYYLDEIKNQMARGNCTIGVVYTGDAILAIENNPDLDYALPADGTNVWYDSVVVLKNSQNIDLAEKFVNFLCRGDIALRNVNEIEYCTPNKLAYEQLDDTVKNNKKIYPDAEYLAKCEIFEDLGTELTQRYADLWLQVTSGD